MKNNYLNLFILAVCAFIIIVLCSITGLIINKRCLQQQKVFGIEQEIITYENNPIMHEELAAANSNYSTNQLLSEIKTCGEKNQVILTNSDIQEEKKQKEISCQMQGLYLSFLAFLNSYNNLVLPYEIADISITKSLDNTAINISFSQEIVSTKNHAL